jgi:hypothetical protein
MSKISNTNYNQNHISVKTDSMVKLVKELAKLGVFKGKPKKRAKSSVGDAIRQDSDMVGYTKTLGGPQMRNIPAIQQIEAGLSQSQIEDIQRRNDAVVASLRGEVQQQRLEDIEAQQGQRFADITKLGGIMNPLLERFRGSTFPAEAMGDKPIDPFYTRRPGVILLGNAPDIQEKRFTESLNEGGPGAKEEQQTASFAKEEDPTGISIEQIKEEEEDPTGISIEQIKEEELPVAKAEFETRTPIRAFTQAPPSALGELPSKIRGGKKPIEQQRTEERSRVVAEAGWQPIPPEVTSNLKTIRDYYLYLIGVTGDEEDTSLKTKANYYKAVYEIVDATSLFL